MAVTEQELEAFPLDHPKRVKIHELVQRFPGMNRNQLQNAAELPLGVLEFHLEKLEEAGELHRKAGGDDRENLFFTSEDVDLWQDPHTRILFGNESTRNVATLLVESPGASTAELAETLDLHEVTVRHHLNRLTENNLVGRVQVGRRVEYHATKHLREWTEELGDRLPE